MNKFETVLRDAIERSCANNSIKRAKVHNQARRALNEWFVDNLTTTNERMEQLLIPTALIFDRSDMGPISHSD